MEQASAITKLNDNLWTVQSYRYGWMHANRQSFNHKNPKNRESNTLNVRVTGQQTEEEEELSTDTIKGY